MEDRRCVELTIPKDLRLEPAPDDPSLTAILWGPLVLAQDVGPRAVSRGAGAKSGAAVADASPVHCERLASSLKPVVGQPGQFRTDVGRIAASPTAPIELAIVPLYRLHDRIFSVYMDLFTRTSGRGEQMARNEQSQNTLTLRSASVP